jgi:hypothetical protein
VEIDINGNRAIGGSNSWQNGAETISGYVRGVIPSLDGLYGNSSLEDRVEGVGTGKGLHK